MCRFFAALLTLVLMFFPPLPLPGAEEPAAPTGGEEGPPFFPLFSLIHTVREGEVFWTPGWPAEFPPDAFTLLPVRPVSIILTAESGEYRLRRNSRGQLEEFPFLLDGTLVQVRVRFDPAGEIRGFSIGPDPVWNAEFLPSPPGEPSLIRFSRGEGVFFIIGEETTAVYSESWFSGEGEFLGFFQTVLGETEAGTPARIISRAGNSGEGETLERHHYDSFGNTTEINGLGGRFSAIYTGQGRPRYWEYYPPVPEDSVAGGQMAGGPPEGVLRYTLQWDERGFPVRLYGEGGEDSPAEYRYEYTLDSRGNWTERRERRMVLRFGALVSSPGTIFKRVIEYGGRGR